MGPHQENAARPYMQHAQAPPSQAMINYNGSTPAPIPGNVAALAQGQQPILNVSLFPYLKSLGGKKNLKDRS
jgi:paired amphipathic helix protein Sin3a